MTLSDKISMANAMHDKLEWLRVKDVREFIRRLKKIRLIKPFWNDIDKLAGDALVHSPSTSDKKCPYGIKHKGTCKEFESSDKKGCKKVLGMLHPYGESKYREDLPILRCGECTDNQNCTKLWDATNKNRRGNET